MSDSYTGWDGKSYPWPPPDGWYEASDGRWWAPGTGPNPPPDTPAPPSRPAGSFQAGDLGGPIDQPLSGEPGTTQLAHSQGHRGPGGQAPRQGHDYGATATFPAGDISSRSGGGGAHDHTAGHPPLDSGLPPPGGGRAPAESTSSGGGGGRRLLFIGLGVVLALLVLGGAFLVLTGSDGDETASDATTASTTTEGTQAEGESDGSTEDGSTDDTVDDGASPTTAATGDGTDQDDDADTATPSDSDSIERFRSILRDNGLTSNKLTDDDVVSFGNSFCTLAEQSSSAEVFDEFRQDAIESTANTSLEPDELGMVIDTAILAFCPDEAARLGIGG